MLLIAGVTCGVLIGGKMLPSIASALWIIFIGWLASILYLDLREPVNYMSLDFDARGFRHEGIGGVSEVAWSEIIDVFYVRSFEPFTNAIETEWHFELKSGEWVEVLLEWPHRKRFARALVENLDYVSKELVASTHRMKGEGRWRCVKEH